MAVRFSRPGSIELSGITLAMVTDGRMEEQSNDKPVETLTGGLVGHSDGPEQCTINGGQAIPRAGFDGQLELVLAGHLDARLTFTVGNLKRVAEGRFMTVDDATDVNTPNKRTFNFHGKVVARTFVPILG